MLGEEALAVEGEWGGEMAKGLTREGGKSSGTLFHQEPGKGPFVQDCRNYPCHHTHAKDSGWRQIILSRSG